MQERPPLEQFRRQQRDIYIPAGDIYFWQGALRDRGDADRELVASQVTAGERTIVDILYGDQHGGQRVVSRFSLVPRDEGMFLVSLARQWNVDRPDPR